METKCNLCGAIKPLKSNTHYLTDAIIRPCLNSIGAKGREKGLFFDISTNQTFLTPHFQRETNIDKIVEVYGREPNADEIEETRSKRAYSVDNVFCSDCEAKFTSIENVFLRNIEKFKTGKFSDSKIIRRFFYLQLWRTAICDENFIIPENTLQYMKHCLQDDCELSEMNRLPLSITYLETPKGCESENGVGIAVGANPYVILMNDFIIQLYDSVSAVQFYALLGINKIETYKSFINYDETEFKIQVIDNASRIKFYQTYYLKKKMPTFINGITWYFSNMYYQVFHTLPNDNEIQMYIQNAIQKYKYLFEENMSNAFADFLQLKCKNNTFVS